MMPGSMQMYNEIFKTVQRNKELIDLKLYLKLEEMNEEIKIP